MTRRALLLSCAGAITLPLAGATTDPIAVARLALCGAALGAIAAIDLAEHRVPNRLVLPATAACAALSLIGGASITALVTGLAIVGWLLLVALARPTALGMGDIKLALLVVVGLDGDASRALAAGLVLAALAGVIVIARSGRAAGRRALPLAPFLAPRLVARPAAMNARRAHTTLASRIVRVLPGALVAAVLWVLRPGLPQLPESLTGQMTVEQLEDVLVFLGWLALIVLLLLAIGRHTRTTQRAPAAMPLADPRRDGRANAKAQTTRVRAPIDAAPTLTVIARPDEQQTAKAVRGAPRVAQTPIEAAVPQLRVALLGSFSIERSDGAARGVRSSTEQLIAYLALRPRGAPRDELVEAIWPGEDPRRTRQRLWQSTSEARKLIGDAFVSRRGHYSLDRTKLAVDADEQEALLAEAKTAITAAAERRVLERGLGLLRGEPLAGWDHVWADTDARRLRATQAELLERLGRARLATDDAHGALEAAEQGLDRDALNEALWRLAMQAETQLGLRESVGRRYERLRGLLDEQLGLEPETETRALYRELLGQH